MSVLGYARRGARRAAFIAGGALRAESQLLRRSGAGDLRVLNFHGTPARERERFREIVLWARENFDVLDPSRFIAIARGEIATPSRRAILFTFDDGLRSNFQVAARELEDVGLRGWFFVNPEFAQTPPSRQRPFFVARVRYLDDPRAMDEESWTPMSRNEIAELAARGHGIGNHTASHAFIPGLSEVERDAEIAAAKRIIEDWTQRSCAAFAWTFAWNAIDRDSWRRASLQHEFCFGACPGTNKFRTMDRHLIFRTNVESSYPMSEAKLLVAGFGDASWAARRRLLTERKAELE